MSKEPLHLSARDLKRLEMLRQVSAGQLTVKQAAAELGLSERQMFRLVAAYRERRLAGLAHGNRGRRPHTRVPDEVRARVVELARTKYAGCSQHALQKALTENEGIHISRSTVRNILLEADLTRPHGPEERAVGIRADEVSQQADAHPPTGHA